MISINLWSKASQLGSKLKDSFQFSTEEKPLVEKETYDKLKEEFEQLKRDFDEKTEKYNNIMNEINNKNKKEENLSETEYKRNLEEIVDKFRNYIINFFGDENNENINNNINLIFINPHDEEFDKKLSEYNKNKFENILIQKFMSENKNIISNLLGDGDDGEKNENSETNDDIKEANSFEALKKIFIKLDTEKKNSIKKIESLKEKLNENNRQMKTMQETIERMQKDYQNIKNMESTMKESISKKEKEFSEKDLKYNEMKNILEKNNNELKEKDIKINSYITNLEQLNIKLKEQNNQITINEKQRFIYEEEIKNLNIKIKSYKENLDLLQFNSDEINTKNIQITELMKTVESLKSSYKLLEESKNEFCKEKNEEINIYKNQILDLTQQLNEEKEKFQNIKKNEEIESIYLQKISELEKQNTSLENNYFDIKKKNEKIEKELEEVNKKMIKELRDNEFLIDKRVISSILVNYFDVNASDITKKNVLETLSSIMEYSNEDRQKMGLKPIHIGDTNEQNKGTLKSMSEGFYNFILNS